MGIFVLLNMCYILIILHTLIEFSRMLDEKMFALVRFPFSEKFVWWPRDFTCSKKFQVHIQKNCTIYKNFRVRKFFQKTNWLAENTEKLRVGKL